MSNSHGGSFIVNLVTIACDPLKDRELARGTKFVYSKIRLLSLFKSISRDGAGVFKNA